jgi:hypothetical protein
LALAARGERYALSASFVFPAKAGTRLKYLEWLEPKIFGALAPLGVARFDQFKLPGTVPFLDPHSTQSGHYIPESGARQLFFILCLYNIPTGWYVPIHAGQYTQG